MVAVMMFFNVSKNHFVNGLIKSAAGFRSGIILKRLLCHGLLVSISFISSSSLAREVGLCFAATRIPTNAAPTFHNERSAKFVERPVRHPAVRLS